MERTQAQSRITAALDILRIRGWTTEQRHRLVDGLQREDAVEVAERAANNPARQQPYHANIKYD